VEDDYYPYIQETFKTLAPVYDLATWPISWIRTKVAKLANAGKPERVLDVGTGTGKQALAFAKRGHRVTGIDYSRHMLERSGRKNRFPNARFLRADAADMPFRKNTFDITCASFSLHEMPLPIREKVLGEITRVTRPGGTLVVVDYSLPRNRLGRFLVYNLVKLYESKYYREFIRSDLEGLLERLGIKVKTKISLPFNAARIWLGTVGDGPTR